MIDSNTIKVGDRVLTKYGIFTIINVIRGIVNPFTLKEEIAILVNFNGAERKIDNDDIIEETDINNTKNNKNTSKSKINI